MNRRGYSPLPLSKQKQKRTKKGEKKEKREKGERGREKRGKREIKEEEKGKLSTCRPMPISSIHV